MKLKIAENVKELRKANSLTQEQLAEALGVTTGAVYKWEAGLSVPEIKLIMEMADVFEVSVDALLGYRQQGNNVEMRVQRIRQCVLEKDFAEAVLEAEKALKKYPNHFEIVYCGALAYSLKYSEDKEENAFIRSNQLFQNAISLLYQNTDPRINETIILGYIAGNYLSAGDTEAGIEILKQNNICNINSDVIGYEYAVTLKEPAKAKEYLLRSFMDVMNRCIRTMAGMAFMYEQTNDKNCMAAVQWMLDYLDSLKKDPSEITFTDKLKAIMMAQRAVWKVTDGDEDAAKEDVKKAFLLAKRFDANPVYNVHGIKFLDEMETETISYDGIGKTAMEAVENFAFRGKELSDEQKCVKGMWESLKYEEEK